MQQNEGRSLPRASGITGGQIWRGGTVANDFHVTRRMESANSCCDEQAGVAAVVGPRFTLHYETGIDGNPHRWRFILRAETDYDELVAEDEEPTIQGERLELLTVVRALESLNQPAHIVIWARSPALREGLLYGLHEWPGNDWCWERFGQIVPVKNRDLWQRIERASRFHVIECRCWRVDPPHTHLTDAGRGTPGCHQPRRKTPHRAETRLAPAGDHKGSERMGSPSGRWWRRILTALFSRQGVTR